MTSLSIDVADKDFVPADRQATVGEMDRDDAPRMDEHDLREGDFRVERAGSVSFFGQMRRVAGCPVIR